MKSKAQFSIMKSANAVLTATAMVVYLAAPLATLVPISALAAASDFLAPQSVGNYSEWSVTPGSSASDKVNAVLNYDGDTTYVYESTNGDRQSFAVSNANVPAGSTINNVTLYVSARESGGSTGIKLLLEKGSGSSNRKTSGTHNLSGSYSTYTWAMSENPFTNDPWTVSDVNSWTIKFGAEKSGSFGTARVTKVYVVVDYTAPNPATISATKIVCSSESDLPNWGNGGANITASTASNFLNTHPNCHVESGWNFQWGTENASNPGDSMVGEAGSPWTTFGPTNGSGVATTNFIVGSATDNNVWVREVLKSGYLAFTGNSTSAEIYCSSDVLNYDNYDRVDNPVAGGTYHCVAFNVALVENTTPLCTDGLDNDNDSKVDFNDEDCAGFKPKLTVEKVVVNQTEAEITTSFFNLFVGETAVTSGSENIFNPGTYTISETANGEVNYSQSWSESCASGHVTLNAGDDVTCTLTNTVVPEPVENTLPLCTDDVDNDGDELVDLNDPDCAPFKPTLTVNKVVIDSMVDGDSRFAPSFFDIFVDLSPVVQGESNTMSTGSHSITESGDNENITYTQSWSEACVEGQVTLNAGDNLTCTLTNTITTPQCGDGLDNESDEKIDANDPGCWTDPNNSETYDANDNSETDPTDVCSNLEGIQTTTPEGLVNNEGQCVEESNQEPTDVCPNIDGDQSQVPEGKVLSDGQCVDEQTSPPPAPSTPKQCNDKIDNDGDTWIDYPEPGCDSPEDDSEEGGTNGGGGGVVAANGPIVGNGPIAPQGQVLGATIELPASCTEYLKDYIKLGKKNDPEEVKKLQTFLNTLGSKLPVTGFYGQLTYDAVKQFQVKEMSNILTPWEIATGNVDKNGTGYVYKTTKRWINLLNCPTLNLPMPQLP